MRTKKTIKSIIYELIPVFLISIIGFIKTKVFISYLGSDMNGYYQFINQLITYLFLAEAGFSTAIIYKLYEPVANGDIKKISQLYYGGQKIFKKIGLFMLIGVVLISAFMITFLTNNIKLIVVLSFILISVANIIGFCFRTKILQAMLAAKQENYKASLITNIIRIINDIVVIIVIIKVPSLWAIAIILLVSKIIEEFVFYVLGKKEFKIMYIDKGDYDTSAYKMTKDLFASQIGYLVFNNVDSLIIMFTKNLGAISVSIYSTYNYVQKFIFSLVAKLSVVTMNYLGNIFIKDSKEKSKGIFNEYLIFDYMVATICSICLFVGIRSFINIWISDSIYILNIFSVALFSYNLFLSVCMEPLTSAISAKGLFKESKYYTIISSSINLVLSLILGNIFGIAGVLFATAVSYILDICFRIILVKNNIFENGNYIFIQFLKANLIYITFIIIFYIFEMYFYKLCTNYFYFFIGIIIVSILVFLFTIFVYYFTFEKTKDLFIRVERLVKNNES